MAETMRDRVRAAAKALTKATGYFSLTDLASHVGIKDYAGRERLRRDTVNNLLGTGELESVAGGKYRWLPKANKPEKRQAMWAILRARHTVSVDDLVELTDSHRDSVLQFLRPLVRQGTVQKLGNDCYRLVEDLGPAVPKDQAKCDRLRDYRERKKMVLEKIDRIFGEVAELRLMASLLGEE